MIKPEQIKALREEPKRLFDLSPREFEEVVAELLASSGRCVEVTTTSLVVSRDQFGLDGVGCRIQALRARSV